MNTSLNKKALVTGASSGIGAVYADRLARRGYDLIIVARDSQRLNSVADRIRRDTGRTVDVVLADLSKKDNIVKVEDIILKTEGLVMVVNNAGYSLGTPFVETDGDVLEDMIMVNVTALTRLSNAAAKAFSQKKTGCIINIGSGIAMMPEDFNEAYGGSKAYVLHFTRNIARQLQKLGIRVQLVLPGAIHTEAWDRAGDLVKDVPKEAVMSVGDLVDSSLKGLDMGEVVTWPSVEDLSAWEKLEEARVAIIPKVFTGTPASRYR